MEICNQGTRVFSCYTPWNYFRIKSWSYKQIAPAPKASWALAIDVMLPAPTSISGVLSTLFREDYQSKDEAFHTANAMSLQNIVVLRLMPIIHSTINMFIRITKRASSSGTIISHREIAEAIAARDPLAAQESMYAHLLTSKKLVGLAHKQLAAEEHNRTLK